MNNEYSSAKIKKDLNDKIAEIIQHTGQTVVGYLDVSLRPKVEKDYSKIVEKRKQKQDEKQDSL